MNITKVCPCGKNVEVKPWLVNRKKYCSKKCLYQYHTRPSGLKYVLHKINPTSFKKGQKPWNTGIEDGRNPNWKGEGAGYDAKHEWVERRLGKPRLCEKCGTTNSKVFQWSNKSGTYKRMLSDWQRLCVKCHSYYDYKNFGARKVFYEK